MAGFGKCSLKIYEKLSPGLLKGMSHICDVGLWNEFSVADQMTHGCDVLILRNCKNLFIEKVPL